MIDSTTYYLAYFIRVFLYLMIIMVGTESEFIDMQEFYSDFNDYTSP